MTGLPAQINDNLSNEMWRACDILRRDNNVGGVMQYTEHLAWLIFLRFLDQEEKNRCLHALVNGEIYRTVLPTHLQWDQWAGPIALVKYNDERGLIAFVRETLLPGLARLDGSRLATTIARLFSEEGSGAALVVRNLPVCASDHNLKDVIEIINGIHFDRDEDFFTITRFYEDLLSRLGQENQIAGEFHTPRPVIRFMVEVIDPEAGETVYDPASGSAGFLAQAYLYMAKKVTKPEDEEVLQQGTFYGKEKKAVAALLGMMNLVLHGVTAPEIIRTNTLEEDVRNNVAERYDVILTNPPFGGKEGPHIQSNFNIKGNATEMLFLQHILKKLQDGPHARAAVVVPEGTLFRGGAFAEVKKILLDHFHLFAVVSLPVGAFAPYSDIKTALLFFQRKDSVGEGCNAADCETWYYEMPLPHGLKKFSKGNPIGDEHFGEAREMWQQWQRYLRGEVPRPFRLATEVRDRWQAYWDWEDYRRSVEEGECPAPPCPMPGASVAYLEAFHHEGPRPRPPFSTWIEDVAALTARGFDLTARNPNLQGRMVLPRPAEITVRLLERSRKLQEMLERVHSQVGGIA